MEKWKVYPDAKGTFVATESGKLIAGNLYDENADTTVEEVDASARLIAAAPDMLETLKYVSTELEILSKEGTTLQQETCSHLLPKIKTTIKKAE